MYAARRFRDARGHPWFPYLASTPDRRSQGRRFHNYIVRASGRAICDIKSINQLV